MDGVVREGDHPARRLLRRAGGPKASPRPSTSSPADSGSLGPSTPIRCRAHSAPTPPPIRRPRAHPRPLTTSDLGHRGSARAARAPRARAALARGLAVLPGAGVSWYDAPQLVKSSPASGCWRSRHCRVTPPGRCRPGPAPRSPAVALRRRARPGSPTWCSSPRPPGSTCCPTRARRGTAGASCAPGRVGLAGVSLTATAFVLTWAAVVTLGFALAGVLALENRLEERLARGNGARAGPPVPAVPRWAPRAGHARDRHQRRRTPCSSPTAPRIVPAGPAHGGRRRRRRPPHRPRARSGAAGPTGDAADTGVVHHPDAGAVHAAMGDRSAVAGRGRSRRSHRRQRSSRQRRRTEALVAVLAHHDPEEVDR